MSIHAIVGKPGAGKSYEAVQRAHDAVESGRCVVTSLPLQADHPFWAKALEDKLLFLIQGERSPEEGYKFGSWDAWDEFGNSTDYQRVLEGSKGETARLGPLIIVDEGLVTFMKMRRGKRGKEAEWPRLMEYFAVHRHNLVDILLMFHDHGQVDPDMKQVIERWHHVVNTSEMTGRNTFQVKTANKGFVQGNAFIDRKNGSFKKSIYELYDSYAEGAGKGTKGKKGEAGLKRSRPIWLRWWAILILICLAISPYFAWQTVKGIRGVTETDGPVGEFGSGNTRTVTTTIPNLAAVPVVQAPRSVAGEFGFPDEALPMLGFDNENIYFGDGTRLNVSADLNAQGFTVVETLACRVLIGKTVITSEGTPNVVLIEYRCEKGN